MAFSKTVSEDLMHVSLIFKLGSSTFHKKKSRCEILRVLIFLRVCCVSERALQWTDLLKKI